MLIGSQLGFYSAGGMVTSVEQVTITIAAGQTSGTATLVTAVNTSYASEHYSGHNIANTSFNPANGLCGIQLTDGSTVTAFRNTSDASFALTVQAIVIAWNPSKIKSIQRGTITMTAATSNTASLTFALTNSVVQYNGLTTTYTSNNPSMYYGGLTLTSGTVTADRGGTSNNMTVYYCLIEFASGVLNSSTQQAKPSYTGSTTGTSTITAVTTGQTMLINGGWYLTGGSATADVYRPYLALTDGTTITSTMSTTSGSTTSNPVGVVEFKASDIKTLNRGTITMGAGTASNTASITAVNLAKTIPNYLGNNTTGSGVNDESRKIANLTLPNSTTPTTARTNSTSVITVTGWETIEFII